MLGFREEAALDHHQWITIILGAKFSFFSDSFCRVLTLDLEFGEKRVKDGYLELSFFFSAKMM